MLSFINIIKKRFGLIKAKENEPEIDTTAAEFEKERNRKKLRIERAEACEDLHALLARIREEREEMQKEMNDDSSSDSDSDSEIITLNRRLIKEDSTYKQLSNIVDLVNSADYEGETPNPYKMNKIPFFSVKTRKEDEMLRMQQKTRNEAFRRLNQGPY